MNVFIFPTDDRSGQATLISHYSAIGHKVFLPKFGTLGLDWSKIATWPMLLAKCTSNQKLRNLDIHGFDRPSAYFGEDHFLTTDKFDSLYASDKSCEIIDLNTENPGIDIFHTLRGGENYIQQYFDIAGKHFPNAKWVSSTLNAWNHAPGREPTNSAKLIPANYENSHQKINNVSIMGNEFELSLLGIDQYVGERSGFASFNHNFAVRQPDDYMLFSKMNALLSTSGHTPVLNYGGNVRSHGADIRFSGENGATGKFGTLSPKAAITHMSTLKAIVHFKQNDWGGGVFYHAMITGTPIITTTRYVNASNSQTYLVNGVNCVYVDTAEQAADAIRKIDSDYVYADNLKAGMRAMKDGIFNDQYWVRWIWFLRDLK